MSIACSNNCTFSRKRLRWRGGPGRGKLTLRLLGGGESIAHCKYLDFTFLPFTFLPFEGGRRTWKRETHTSVTGRGRRALHIANPLTLPFYLLPFYLLRTGRRTEQSAGLIQRRRVHRPPVMDWVHPAIRDRVDFL